MIKELCTIMQALNKEVDNINYGGCCVFAESIYPYLVNLGLEPQIKIVEFGGSEIDLTIVRKELNGSIILSEWHSKRVEFNHIAIQFIYKGNTYIIDSTGVKKVADYQYSTQFLYGFITHIEARNFSKDRSGWNTRFNRTDIKRIKHGMKTRFNSHFNNQFVTFIDKIYN